MRANFTPFVDLFSILAIGLLLVMTMTAGTDRRGGERSEDDGGAVSTEEADSPFAATAADGPSRARPVLVWLYFDDSEEAMRMMVVEPYFLRDGVEAERPDDVVVTPREEGVEVLFLSDPGAGLSVGFRVAAVRDMDAIGRRFDFTVVRAGESPGTVSCHSRVGMWREPEVSVGAGTDPSCGGVGVP